MVSKITALDKRNHRLYAGYMAKSRRILSPIISPISSQLNFIIVLSLAFFLVVIVSAVVNQVSIQTRANFLCGPTPTLPATQCAASWQFTRDANNCPIFTCTSAVNP